VGYVGGVPDVPDDMWIDANGAPTELYRDAGREVVVHWDDVPEKDLTVVDGIPCTTALRTVIDLAPELTDDELRRIIGDCLARGLFTVDEAVARVGEEDMARRAGARRLRALLAR
jgi:hypothetical protein